jgi:hypothetical protein
MKVKNFLFLFLVLYASHSFSQGENNNWYFGDRASVNFATTPISVYYSAMSQLEGVASISDSNGDLLFYTNGINVWNRQHQIMPNGIGLSGNNSTQQVLIVPYPLHNNMYYIFTTSLAFSTTPNIAYTIVDLSLGSLGTNGSPLGDVIASTLNTPILINNQFIFGTEAITYTLHNDQDKYWILIPNGSFLYSYLLDGNGLSTTPSISNIPLPSPLLGFGEIKVSPNLPSSLGLSYTNFVSITRWNNPIDISISSFNNSTGLLTNNYQVLVGATNSYSTEYSSNGLLMYSSSKLGEVYCYDLFSTDTNNFVREIYNSSFECYTLQRAKNDEIYLSVNGNDHLSRITNSNSFLNSNVLLDDILINGVSPRTRKVQYGLPQLIKPTTNSGCIENLILNSPETYNNYTYNASNSITTINNYMVSNNRNIIFKAGGSITLKPNTLIAFGSNFLGKIENCIVNLSKSSNYSDNSSFYLLLNLNKDETSSIKLYPNPTNSFITITSNDLKFDGITITSFEGRIVFNKKLSEAGLSYQVDVSSYPKAIYFITVQYDNGKLVTEKLIKE